MSHDTIEQHLGPLRDLDRWFSDQRIPWVVVGGVAASLLGKARFTRDVDVLIEVGETPLDRFVLSGEHHGFVPRIQNAVEFAGKARVLLITHIPTELNVDLMLALLPIEMEIIKKSQSRQLSGLTVQVPRPEHLILMKAVASRPQDLTDIESVLIANPEIKTASIRRTLMEFEEALGRDDLITRFDDVVNRFKKGKRLLTQESD